MTYTTQELTASLQELTAKAAEKGSSQVQQLPAQMLAGEFSISQEVENFLEESQSYSAKTRSVNVGNY